jgi:hypothetical protein
MDKDKFTHIFLFPFLLPWRNSPTRARIVSFLRFRNHEQRHTTVGRTPLDEGSARRRDLYLTIHTTLTCLGGIRTATPASERPQTLPLDLLATGIVFCPVYPHENTIARILHGAATVDGVVIQYFNISFCRSSLLLLRRVKLQNFELYFAVRHF